jgi:hypothetical protein
MGLTVSKSNRACDNFPHYFWSSDDYFIHFQSVDFCVINLSRTSPQIILTIEPRMGIYSGLVVSISYQQTSFGYMLLEAHLTTYHSNIGALIRKVSE